MKLYKDYNSHPIMNRLNNLPNELYRKVYEFIKPTLSDHIISKNVWCSCCGEYIKNDDISVQKPLISKNHILVLCLDCFNLKLDFINPPFTMM